MIKKLLTVALIASTMLSLIAQPKAPNYNTPQISASNGFTTNSHSNQSSDSWSEDFENGIGNFTVIKGGDPNSFEHSTSGGNKKPGCVIINHHRTEAHDDYLITPAMKVTRASYLSFWAKNQSKWSPEKYDVFLSTEGTAEEKFTVEIAKDVEPLTDYTRYQYDLKDYIGKTVHIAIHIKTKNKWKLYLDDFDYVILDPHDLAITDVAPGFVNSGKKIKPEVTIFNKGADTESTWSLNVKDGKGYDKTVTNVVAIASGESRTVKLPDWSPADGEFTLTAKITVNGDADDTNNSKEAKVNVAKLSYEREKIYAFNLNDRTDPKTWKNHVVNVDIETGKLSNIKKTTLEDVHTGDFVGAFDNTMLIAVESINKKAYVVNGNGDTYFYRNIDIPFSVSGFTWDQTDNKLYAVAYDDSDAILYSLDESYKATPVGKIKPGVVYSIACDTKGNLYGLSATSKMYSINKATGAGTEIEKLGLSTWLSQGMGFDRTTNNLYATINKYYSFRNQKGGLYTIDVKTGKAKLIGNEFIDHLTLLGVYTNIPDPNDLSVKQITQKEVVIVGNSESPKVTILNKGTKEQSTWSVKLSDGKGYDKTIDNLGKIAPNETKVVTFSNWVPKKGKQTLTATVTLKNDKYPKNNTKKLENIQVITLSYEKNTIYAFNNRDWSDPRDWGNHLVKVNRKTAVVSSVKKISPEKVYTGDLINSKGMHKMLGVAFNDYKVYLINGNGDTYYYNTIKNATSKINGLTWDSTTDKLYASSGDEFFVLDDDFNATKIKLSGIAGILASIACDSKGNMYGLGRDDKLYKIDQKTGSGTEVGELGIDISFAQNMGFDRASDVLYATLYKGRGTGGLYTIDTKTGKATQIEKDFKDHLAMLGTYSKSIGTNIKTFSFAEQFKPATLSLSKHTINVTVKAGTDATKLKATFTLSDGATAKIGDADQVSGTTVNDFSKPVTYKVTAEDGETTQEWVVTTTVETTTSIDDDLEEHGIAIYPNPSSGIFNVVVDKPFTMKIIDIKGKIVVENKLINNTTQVEISHSGIYFINFTNDKTSLTQRIIVSK